MRLTDLSHPLAEGMPFYPADEAPVFKPVFTYGEHGVNMQRMTFSTHIGTHLDCPSHMTGLPLYTDNVPLERFQGSAAVIDCSTCIEAGLIQASVMDTLAAGDWPEYLLFFTGTDRLWGDARYFESYPVFSTELTALLAGSAIKGVGVDTISVDPVDSTSYANHRELLGAGKIIIENLTNLRLLPQSGFQFWAMPLGIEKGDGSPVRAVAVIE